MERPEDPVVMTLTEVVRHNVRRLREARGLSLRQLAERLDFWDGTEEKPWTHLRVTDIEGGRSGRNRAITPDEMMALAREFDVSLIELMTPPATVAVGDEEKLDRPVRVSMGRDALSPDVFFRTAFMLPMNYREGIFGEVRYPKEIERREGIVREAYAAVLGVDVSTLTEEQVVDLWREEEDRIVDWIVDHYGLEVARSIFMSDRQAKHYGLKGKSEAYYASLREGEEE